MGCDNSKQSQQLHDDQALPMPSSATATPQNSGDVILKYIIVGDAGVGKTCLLNQFVDSKFDGNQQHTIGVEFGKRSVDITGRRVHINIWDTAGQERFQSITRQYYRGSHAALLMYDVTRRVSFQHLKNWVTDVKKLTSPHTVILLIGNKTDLNQQREVSFEEGKHFADENGFAYMETSAKTGDNVETSFLSTAKQIIELVENGTIDLDTFSANL